MAGRNRKVEQGEASRDALVAAATALFAEKGFAETSTTEIVHRAGLTRGALYHHFPDKEQLFRAALEAIEGDLVDRIAAADAAAGSDPLHRLLAGIDAFLDACLEPAVQRILLQEALSVVRRDRGQQPDRPRCARRQLSLGLAAAIDAGRLPDQPAEPLAHLLYGALVQAGIAIATSPDPPATRTSMGAAVHRLLHTLATG